MGRSTEFWRLIAERKRLMAMLHDPVARAVFSRADITDELARNERAVRELAAWHQR